MEPPAAGAGDSTTYSREVEEGFILGTLYHYEGYGFFIPESYERVPHYISKQKREKLSTPDSKPETEAIWLRVYPIEGTDFYETEEIDQKKVPEDVLEEIEAILPFSTLMGRKFEEMGCYE